MGEFSADLLMMNLANGGTAILTNPDDAQYLRVFRTSGTGNDLFGVVGQPTILVDLPTAGYGRYDGIVIMAVDNTDGTYALTGSARVTANRSGSVDTHFAERSGRLNGDSDVNISGTISMAGAQLTGTAFSGGDLSTTGTVFDRSGVLTTTHNGQFFGRNADEAGGTFTLGANDLSVSALFSVD